MIFFFVTDEKMLSVWIQINPWDINVLVFEDINA